MVTVEEYLVAADEMVAKVLSQWDLTSTALAGLLALFTAYLVLSQTQPDTHPMLLARQAQPSPVRQPGQSAVYRSHTSPHGLDLNHGLNVKDPGANNWGPGRNGDLRDVWRRVVQGKVDGDGQGKGVVGRIITVLGSEETIDHDLNEISRQINIIGQHIKKQGGARVAIYLPNSIELLATLFACAFYELTAIIMPYDQPAAAVTDMLSRSGADTMIAAVGTLPFDSVAKEYAGLKSLFWVVDPGSKHLDWDELPKGTNGLYVNTWQEIMQKEGGNITSELPALVKTPTKNILMFWLPETGEPGEMVEYTQGNIVSAMSAQLTNIPTPQKITPSDLFLPVDSLASNYTLVLTLSALYYNASVALNSVAGRDTDLIKATRGVSPTIIAASALTLVKLHARTAEKLSNPLRTAIHWLQTRTLTQNGILPTATLLTRINDSLKPSLGTKPGKLRLVFVAEQAGGNSPPLSALALSDLRIFTGARVIYALTAPKVAGAVTQTTFYDYRVDPQAPGAYSHFGAPMTSVEVWLRDTKYRKVSDEEVVGEIVVRGPAVVGGEAGLGVNGRINEDLTLSYL